MTSARRPRRSGTWSACGIVGVHAEALHQAAQGAGRPGRGLRRRAGGGLAVGVGPRLVAFGNRPGSLVLQRACGGGRSQFVEIGVGPAVGCFDGIGGEVVELPLVVERRGAVGVAAGAGGGQVAHAGLGPRGRVVEGADQLPEVVRRRRRPRSSGTRTTRPSKLAATWAGTWICSGAGGFAMRPSRRATPDAPLSPSGMLSRVMQVDGPALVGRLAVDHGHQVATGQLVDLGERPRAASAAVSAMSMPAAPSRVGTRSTCDVGASTTLAARWRARRPGRWRTARASPRRRG